MYTTYIKMSYTKEEFINVQYMDNRIGPHIEPCETP